MTPFQYASAHALARFKEDRTLAALKQMRRRRQSNRSAADNRHRQLGHNVTLRVMLVSLAQLAFR